MVLVVVYILVMLCVAGDPITVGAVGKIRIQVRKLLPLVQDPSASDHEADIRKRSGKGWVGWFAPYPWHTWPPADATAPI